MALTESGPVGAPRFTIGGVIATSFTVLFSNFLRFLAIMVVIVAPAAGLFFVGGFVSSALDDRELDFSFTGSLSDPVTLALVGYCAIVFLIAYSLALAAITHGALQALRGEPVGIGTCLGHSFRVLPRMFAAVLIFIVGLGVVVGGAAWAFYTAMWNWGEAVQPTLIAWGIAVVVVGLILLVLVVVLTWVFVPAVVAERAGPIACFRRSLALTKGRRWAILAIVVLTGLVNGAESVLTDAIQAAGEPTVGEALDLAFTAFITALGAVLSAVGYSRLRGEKEGVVIEDVVKVFD
jgi:hypothetical protein